MFDFHADSPVKLNFSYLCALFGQSSLVPSLPEHETSAGDAKNLDCRESQKPPEAVN
jgi:hypothetical protein